MFCIAKTPKWRGKLWCLACFLFKLKNRNWEHSIQLFLYIFTALYQKLLFGFVLAETQKQNVALLLLCVYSPPPPPFVPLSLILSPFLLHFFWEFEKIFACIHRSGVGCVCEICKCRTHNGLWNQFQFPTLHHILLPTLFLLPLLLLRQMQMLKLLSKGKSLKLSSDLQGKFNWRV